MILKIDEKMAVIPMEEYEELQNIKDNYDSLLQKEKELYENRLEKINATFLLFKQQMLHGDFSFVLDQPPYSNYFHYSVIPTEKDLADLDIRRAEIKQLEHVPTEMKHSFLSRFKLW